MSTWSNSFSAAEASFVSFLPLIKHCVTSLAYATRLTNIVYLTEKIENVFYHKFHREVDFHRWLYSFLQSSVIPWWSFKELECIAKGVVVEGKKLLLNLLRPVLSGRKLSATQNAMNALDWNKELILYNIVLWWLTAMILRTIVRRMMP